MREEGWGGVREEGWGRRGGGGRGGVGRRGGGGRGRGRRLHRIFTHLSHGKGGVCGSM